MVLIVGKDFEKKPRISGILKASTRGARALIVKIGQPVPGLKLYTRHDAMIRAKRMGEPFVIETRRGWDQGRRNDWLVSINGDLWHVVADEDFQKIYRPYEPGLSPWPDDYHPGEAPL